MTTAEDDKTTVKTCLLLISCPARNDEERKISAPEPMSSVSAPNNVNAHFFQSSKYWNFVYYWLFSRYSTTNPNFDSALPRRGRGKVLLDFCLFCASQALVTRRGHVPASFFRLNLKRGFLRKRCLGQALF